MRIEVTHDTRSCELEGNLLEIRANAVFAIRSIIEAIEEVDADAAEEFKKSLPVLCEVALLTSEDVAKFVSLIRLSKGGKTE